MYQPTPLPGLACLSAHPAAGIGPMVVRELRPKKHCFTWKYPSHTLLHFQEWCQNQVGNKSAPPKQPLMFPRSPFFEGQQWSDALDHEHHSVFASSYFLHPERDFFRVLWDDAQKIPYEKGRRGQEGDLHD